MRSATTPVASVELTREFRRLNAEGKASRGPRTTAHAMAQHPAYQAIVGLGEPAIPLILNELAHDVDHWFSALKAITGANPVCPEDQGDLVKMARSWIDWGRSHGYPLV